MTWRSIGDLFACGLVVALAACSSEPPPPALFFAKPVLPDVRLGQQYTARLDVSGGVEPYMFSIATGALPEGIQLGATTGRFGGVAAKPGRVSFSVLVTDAVGQKQSQDLSIYVIPDALEIVTAVLPSGKEGTAYDQTLVAKGGIAPYAWTTTSTALPAGVTLDPSGRLQGTPTVYGGYDFTVRVTDQEAKSKDAALHLTLSSLSPLITTATMLTKARVGESYSTALVAEGGQPPYSWEVSAGALPAGVSLATNGELAGVPTEAGTFTVMVTVRDAARRTDMADFTVRVLAPLTIETANLPQVVRGRAYHAVLAASGGEPPYIWTLANGGSLPTGITFTPDGTFDGQSTAVGDYPLTIRVRDADGFQKSALLTLRVSDRYVYEVTSPVSIPTVCTSTDVSYTAVPIDVPDSFQVSDVNVAVDITYSWGTGTRNRRAHQRTLGAPFIALYGPDGSVSFLCGNGVDVPGGVLCDFRDLAKEFDDDSGSANQPERPLSVFDGLNARGRWLLVVGIAEPTCTNQGTINSVRLSIQDDRRPDTFVVVRGYRKNNLITEPFVRSCSPACSGMVENELFLTAVAYDVGPNGYPEAGEGDDVRSPVPLTWSWQGGPIPGVTLGSDGHVTVGDWGQSGCQQHRCAGTGQSTIIASGGGLTVSLPLRVVPPEWNPEHREY